MHYQFKQDLAMAYFPDRSKESAGKLLAREIHTNEPLMAELSKTANPERELSTAEINQMKRRTPPNANSSPPNNSKSSSPSSVNPDPRRGDEHIEKYRHYGE